MKNFLNRFEIFQNKVGRPSNEILRKRKIFYGIAIGTGVLLVGGMVGFLTAFSTNKLSGGLFDFLKPTPVSERFNIIRSGNCITVKPPKSATYYDVQIKHKKSKFGFYNKPKIWSKYGVRGETNICLQKEEYDPEYQAIYVKTPTGSARKYKPLGGKANLSGWAYKEYQIDWPNDMPIRTEKNPANTTRQPVAGKTFTVTFDKNTASSIGKTQVSCNTSGNNCDITLPSITAQKDYQVYGWNTRKDGHGIEQYQPGQKININRNFTLYAITAYNSNTSNKFVLKHGVWDRNSVDIYPPKGVMSYDVEFWAKKPGASDYTKKYWSINLENGKQFGYLLKQQYSNVEDHAIYIRVRDNSSSSFWSNPDKWKPDGSRYDSGKGWVIKEFKGYNFGGSTPPPQPTKPVSDTGIDGITKTVSQAYIDRLNKVDLSSYHHKSGWPANRWRTTYYYDDAKKNDSRFKYDTKHNWYTINGELAVASATTKYGKHGETKKIYYFTYGKDETIFIKFRDYPSAGDKWYRARIVDDCGACTKVTQNKKDTQLLDVLTKSSSTGNHVIDVAIPKH